MTEPSEQWYWKHGRNLLGPLDTAALEQLVRQRRVTDRDQVRLATDDVWLSGAEVKALFAGGDVDRSSSEAAARLLSQSARLRQANVENAGPGSVVGIWRRFKCAVREAGGPLAGLMDRCGDLAGWCWRRVAPLLNRYMLLAVVAVALSAIVVLNIRIGSDARIRRIYDELSQAWIDLAALQARGASEDEFRTFGAALLPGLNRDLETLIGDSRHAPGRSADSFSWMDSAERGWEAAHTRKALIQAIQAFRTLTSQPLESVAESPSREIFQQNMDAARELLDGGMRRRTVVSTTRPRSRSDTSELVSPPVLGLVVLDVLLIAAGLWYWRRRRR